MGQDEGINMAKALSSMFCIALAASALAAPPLPANPMSGKTVADLAKILESDAPEMDRANAALALAEFVTPPDSPKGKKAPEWELKIPEGFLDACTIGLADRAGSVRFYSSHALAQAGADALPALVEAAKTDNDDQKISAIHGIAMMAREMGGGRKGGPQGDMTKVFGPAVPVLRKALKDENYIVRETACATLSRLGTAGAPALDDLIALLKDKHFCVVNRAVEAVAAADPSGARSVPALLDALESEHDVREFIVKEFAAMGKAAKPAVPALCKLVGEDKNSWQVALESTKALLRIVTYEDKPAQDAMVAQRNQALSAIGKALMKQDAKFLQARIRNTVLDHAGYCPIGPEAEPLVEWFEQALREFAATEKGHFGPPLPRVVRFLAGVGKTYKTEHLVALAKELQAAKDTREAWRKEFAPLLKLESKQ